MADRGQGRRQDTAERPSLAVAGTPFLQVVRGDASAEEIAALVAALMAVAATRPRSGESAPGEPVRSAWNAPSRVLHAPLSPSAGGWRLSALPS